MRISSFKSARSVQVSISAWTCNGMGGTGRRRGTYSCQDASLVVQSGGMKVLIFLWQTAFCVFSVYDFRVGKPWAWGLAALVIPCVT